MAKAKTRAELVRGGPISSRRWRGEPDGNPYHPYHLGDYLRDHPQLLPPAPEDKRLKRLSGDEIKRVVDALARIYPEACTGPGPMLWWWQDMDTYAWYGLWSRFWDPSTSGFRRVPTWHWPVRALDYLLAHAEDGPYALGHRNTYTRGKKQVIEAWSERVQVSWLPSKPEELVRWLEERGGIPYLQPPLRLPQREKFVLRP